MLINEGTVHELHDQIKLLRTQQNSKFQKPLNQFWYQDIGQDPILERLSHSGNVLPSLDDLAVKYGVQAGFEGVEISQEGGGLTLVLRSALQEGDVSVGESVCVISNSRHIHVSKFCAINTEQLP